MNNYFLRKFQCTKIAYFVAQEAACSDDWSYFSNKRERTASHTFKENYP